MGGLEARLASSEAEERELKARLNATETATEGLRATYAALKKAHGVCLFLERRRDFADELPPGVLLKIMDHAPTSRCVSYSVSRSSMPLLRSIHVLILELPDNRHTKSPYIRRADAGAHGALKNLKCIFYTFIRQRYRNERWDRGFSRHDCLPPKLYLYLLRLFTQAPML